MNILIVDDEPPVREQLRWMLADSPYTVYEAASGEEALRLLQDHPIDFLIADIRMPGMDGITLIRHCLVEHPHTWSIVLSNYAEFSLAQQAIRYGAKSYLLKATLTADELKDELDKLIRQKREHQAPAMLDQNERLTVLNALFDDRLNGRITTAELLRRVRKHRLDVFLGPYERSEFVLFHADRFSRWIAEKYKGQRDLAVFSILNVGNEFIRRFGGQNHMFHLGDQRFLLVLFRKPQPEPDLPAALAELKTALRDSLGLDASMLHGYAFGDLDGLFEQVRLSLPDFREFFYRPVGVLLGRNQLPVRDEADVGDDYQYFAALFEKKEEFFRAEQLSVWIESFFNWLSQVRRRPDRVAEDLTALVGFIERTGYAVGKEVTDRLRGSDFDRLADYRELFQQWLGENRLFAGCSREIMLALHYIHEHYRKKLTLDDMCAAVNLSRSHFSKIFKRETGKTPMEYVEELRMNLSRMLLRTTSFSVGEISEMVGIGDIFYFSKLYKKHFNVSPSKDRLRDRMA
jgi:DNA-binding NarL/FixJ family response regulator/AraC-like DNA-binding protein